MSIDIPGYAMISGGPDNGKYVDKHGKRYRRSGNTMYEVESGDAAPVAVLVEPGTVIGQIAGEHKHPGDDGIANKTRYSGDGVDEVLRSSLEEQDDEAAEAARLDAEAGQPIELVSGEMGTITDSLPWQEPAADDVVPASIGGLHAPSAIPSHEIAEEIVAAKPEVAPTVDSLIETYSPAELLSMAQSMRKQLELVGADVSDVKPRKGQAASSIRHNAELIIKHADA